MRANQLKGVLWGRVSCLAAQIALIMLILCSVGCKTLVLPAFSPKGAGEYHSTQAQDGLVVAVQAMTDRAENKKYFGHDLVSARLLPVLIVVTNQNQADSFLIVREKCTVGQTNESITAGNSGVGNRSLGLGLGAAGVAALSPALIIASAKIGSDETEIRHSLISNEFQTRTLGPNESTFGFLYITLPKDGPAPNPLPVRIEATDLKSRKAKVFDFILSW